MNHKIFHVEGHFFFKSITFWPIFENNHCTCIMAHLCVVYLSVFSLFCSFIKALLNKDFLTWNELLTYLFVSALWAAQNAYLRLSSFHKNFTVWNAFDVVTLGELIFNHVKRLSPNLNESSGDLAAIIRIKSFRNILKLPNFHIFVNFLVNNVLASLFKHAVVLSNIKTTFGHTINCDVVRLIQLI